MRDKKIYGSSSSGYGYGSGTNSSSSRVPMENDRSYYYQGEQGGNAYDSYLASRIQDLNMGASSSNTSSSFNVSALGSGYYLEDKKDNLVITDSQGKLLKDELEILKSTNIKGENVLDKMAAESSCSSFQESFPNYSEVDYGRRVGSSSLRCMEESSEVLPKTRDLVQKIVKNNVNRSSEIIDLFRKKGIVNGLHQIVEDCQNESANLRNRASKKISIQNLSKEINDLRKEIEDVKVELSTLRAEPIIARIDPRNLDVMIDFPERYMEIVSRVIKNIDTVNLGINIVTMLSPFLVYRAVLSTYVKVSHPQPSHPNIDYNYEKFLKQRKIIVGRFNKMAIPIMLIYYWHIGKTSGIAKTLVSSIGISSGGASGGFGTSSSFMGFFGQPKKETMTRKLVFFKNKFKSLDVFKLLGIRGYKDYSEKRKGVGNEDNIIKSKTYFFILIIICFIGSYIVPLIIEYFSPMLYKYLVENITFWIKIFIIFWVMGWLLFLIIEFSLFIYFYWDKNNIYKGEIKSNILPKFILSWIDKIRKTSLDLYELRSEHIKLLFGGLLASLIFLSFMLIMFFWVL